METHLQEPPSDRHTFPLVGHVPPHVGTWEIAHVLSEATQVQEFWPDPCPQTCPLGQSPPHVGVSERKQEGTHVQ